MSQIDENRICRVLLVDDSDSYLRALTKLLSREKDIVVVGEAQDGRAAVEQAAKLRPDVIIMDIMMPRIQSQRRQRTAPDTAWSLWGPVRSVPGWGRRCPSSDPIGDRPGRFG